MRVLLDANIYISFLLTRNPDSPPRLAVEAALDAAYVLLMTQGVIAELRHKAATKPYLAQRITQSEIERLVQGLVTICEVVPEIREPLPAIGNDRKDDYLFAHANLANADFLVSGDLGVRAVGRIGSVRIVTPAEFVRILDASGRSGRESTGLR